jgi:hypothetical protein
VASLPFLQELSNELSHEAQQLYRLKASWGSSYIAFAPAIAGVEMIGIRHLGAVALKGLDRIEISEVVPFAPGEAEDIAPLEAHEPMVTMLRQERASSGSHRAASNHETTHERAIVTEIVICVRTSSNDTDDDVLIGVWDPRSDDIHHPLRLPRGDFQRLFSLKGDLSTEVLEGRKESVREMYERLSLKTLAPTLPFAPYRNAGEYEAYILGEEVEKL